eukprot:2772018-Alexandrium_andersonii.AAC.1
MPESKPCNLHGQRGRPTTYLLESWRVPEHVCGFNQNYVCPLLAGRAHSERPPEDTRAPKPVVRHDPDGVLRTSKQDLPEE